MLLNEFRNGFDHEIITGTIMRIFFGKKKKDEEDHRECIFVYPSDIFNSTGRPGTDFKHLPNSIEPLFFRHSRLIAKRLYIDRF